MSRHGCHGHDPASGLRLEERGPQGSAANAGKARGRLQKPSQLQSELEGCGWRVTDSYCLGAGRGGIKAERVCRLVLANVRMGRAGGGVPFKRMPAQPLFPSTISTQPRQDILERKSVVRKTKAGQSPHA